MVLVINVFVSFRHTKKEKNILIEEKPTNKRYKKKKIENEKLEDISFTDENDADEEPEYDVVRYRLKDYENSIKIIRQKRNINKNNNQD